MGPGREQPCPRLRRSAEVGMEARSTGSLWGMTSRWKTLIRTGFCCRGRQVSPGFLQWKRWKRRQRLLQRWQASRRRRRWSRSVPDGYRRRDHLDDGRHRRRQGQHQPNSGSDPSSTKGKKEVQSRRPRKLSDRGDTSTRDSYEVVRDVCAGGRDGEARGGPLEV